MLISRDIIPVQYITVLQYNLSVILDYTIKKH
jgi:hypothetical protein